MLHPVCPYCGRPATLFNGGAILVLATKARAHKFWACPPCDAYVACHRKGHPIFMKKGKVVISDGTYPLGSLANEALRTLRQRTHGVFDPLWKDVKIENTSRAARAKVRTKAYSWLAALMNLPVSNCHIGMFDEEQCLRAIEFCKNELGYRKTDVK